MSNQVPPSDGVVRNSALSFVAPAQSAIQQNPGASTSVEQAVNREEMSQTERLVPAGLKALVDVCSRLYPDQQNPLQVTTRLKYWLGGQDPLDYISMYWHPGKPKDDIPPHWLYVSFGLSDLHGDGRVHPPPDRVLLSSATPPPSGYGLELTLRLSAEAGAPPPLWPAALLQSLARYVFTTGNKFCAGDHISWHAALDGAGGTRVRHLLVAEDPQLPNTVTPHGTVTFLQMVGCTGKELRAAQTGSGFDVLKLISEDSNCGGAWLVTRSRRCRSARGLRRVRTSAAAQLAGVSAGMCWRRTEVVRGDAATGQTTEEQPSSPSQLSPSVEQQIKDILQRGLSSMSTDRTGPEGHMSTDSFEMSSIEKALPQIPELMQGSWRSEGEDSVEYLDGVELMLNAEGASLLPLAINGRVLHGRHFTWRQAGRAVTLLSPAVAGAFATVDKPYAARGAWLQILIPKELANDMSKQVACLSKLVDTDSESDSDEEDDRRTGEAPTLPFTLNWPRHRLKISVVHNHELL